MTERIFQLIEEGEAYRRSSDYRKALGSFKKALALSRRQQDTPGLLDATLAIADVCRIVGDFDGAVEYYTEALELCEAFCDELTAADAMVGLGLSYRAIGMWKKAMMLIGKAKAFYIRRRDRKGRAFALWAEAGTLRIAGKVPEAIAAFKEAKRLFTAAGYESGIGYCLAGLGGTHRIAGKPAESLAYYKQANALFSRIGDTFGTAYTHCGIGNACRMDRSDKKALDHFRQATALYKKIGDIVSYSYTLWSLATLHKLQGDYARTRKYIAEARKNFTKTRDPRGLIYCDLTDAEVAWLEGDDAIAQALSATALDNAKLHAFGLELCHARLISAAVRKPFRPGFMTAAPPCYGRIGVVAAFTQPPFNIP